MKANQVKRFQGTIIGDGSGLGWKVVDIPFDVQKTFGKGDRIPVRGTVNGFPFRTSLFPRKKGPHFLMLNKQMQKGAGASEIGEKVRVTIEFDDAERRVVVPDELEAALVEVPSLAEYYSSLSYSMQKFMADHVAGAKSAETRVRRGEQIAAILLEMMEGEQTPPPILLREFAHDPVARRGWQKLSTSQKRGHLWGIFYYKPGPARERRVAKAIAAMREYADK